MIAFLTICGVAWEYFYWKPKQKRENADKKGGMKHCYLPVEKRSDGRTEKMPLMECDLDYCIANRLSDSSPPQISNLLLHMLYFEDLKQGTTQSLRTNVS